METENDIDKHGDKESNEQDLDDPSKKARTTINYEELQQINAYNNPLLMQAPSFNPGSDSIQNASVSLTDFISEQVINSISDTANSLFEDTPDKTPKEKSKKRKKSSTPNQNGQETQTVIPPGLELNKKQGRPVVPFSQAKKKGNKLKKLDDSIKEIAGTEKDKELLLQAYKESSFGRGLFAKTEEAEILEKVGLNAIRMIHELPPMSPIRQPLIQALGRDISSSLLRKVMNISQSTIKRAKAIKMEESLLFTLRYKPGVTREKRTTNNNNNSIPEEPVEDIAQQLENASHAFVNRANQTATSNGTLHLDDPTAFINAHLQQ